MIDKNTHSRKTSPRRRIARGFVQTGGLIGKRVSKAAEKRGFAETRLLTHWAEVAGPATAAISRPVKVGYGREGFGATLTLLTNGANAPMLQAELPKIRERVNSCYGYAAISRIRLTQTSESGFGEKQADYDAPAKAMPDPERLAQLDAHLSDVSNEGLRSALETLGHNILSRKIMKTGKGVDPC
ncbi:MAG: DUF721 domain-containing protein [Paracoccaceae bacterium]